MLTMREDQLTLGIANETSFVEWYVTVFMPKFMPIYCKEVSKTIREKRVAYGRKLAISYGFSDPTSQAHFVTFMWEIGPIFYTFPGYKEIIEATEQPIRMRIDRLYDEITEEQEDAVIKGYNPKDWQPQN